ncbi:MAG TPA: type II restriction endonuclease [Thermoanaerobaculia bacterium]|nr:type II restriction endonuclease [Thermoanaerobaculia bacterium]
MPKLGSHQHELNGSGRLRAFFGEHKIKGPLRWHYFADGEEPAQDVGSFTFYDSRLKGAFRTGRKEWRMYYTGQFLSRAAPGDLLVLVRTISGEVHALVFEAASNWLRAAKTLFDIVEEKPTFKISSSTRLDRHSLEFVSTRIIEELQLEIDVQPGTEYEETAAAELEMALKVNRPFPAPARLSDVARSLVQVDESDPDDILLKWLQTEELVFKAIERLVVDEKLQAGFRDVDEFVDYSLSVHNRRKSRMGLALQNHLAKLFTLKNIRFSPQAYTENRKKPDFIFPGSAEYSNPRFRAQRLTMLAAKSSCKERWTQVLTEADRISIKHLCTLEPAISEAQTQEMTRQRVVLVVPNALQVTFSPRQREKLMSLAAFIELIRKRQK